MTASTNRKLKSCRTEFTAYFGLDPIEQQDIQTLLRIRASNKEKRVANSNQIRGLLAEYGIVIPIGFASLKRKLPLILEDAENSLTPLSRGAINGLYLEHQRLCEVIKKLDNQLKGLIEAPGTSGVLYPDLGE